MIFLYPNAAAFLPTSLESWSGYLLVTLIVLLSYQQLRLYHFRREAARREELFRIVAENAADMIALVDAKGRRLYNSPAYEKILGYSAEELAKTPALEQVHPEDRFRVLEAAREALRTGTGKALQYRIRHKDGTWRMLESTASTIKNAHGEVEKLVIVNRDITERKRLEEQQEHDSFHDPLTNLPNRRLFLNRLQHCFVRTQRDPAYRYAVLLLDLDGFRALADSIGPAAGDGLIIEAGRRVQACLRERDTVARPTTNLPSDDVLLPRSGGDEFAVILEEIGDPIQAMRTATRIQEAFSMPFVWVGGPVKMSASIGIAISTADQHAAEDLLVDADNALQRAQVLGGSRCEVHDEGMHVRVIRRLKLEGELKTAIDRGQFPLCFQPIVNLETRQIVGLEALLRWQHPQHGTVLPSKFIEVAEDIGLTISLGKVVIRQACDEMRTWQSRHLTPLPLVMTVNISAKQFVSADLVKDVRAALRETQVDPCRLQLEVAEHTVMADPALSLEVLNRLKHLGIRISIGDFGSGQSSLSLLRRLSIDELKIDRALVNNMLADRISCDIAGLIVTVARSLKVQVVAEGIETAVQLDRLRKLGCEFGQGYFFSAPVGSQVAEQLLQESLEKSAK